MYNRLQDKDTIYVLVSKCLEWNRDLANIIIDQYLQWTWFGVVVYHQGKHYRIECDLEQDNSVSLIRKIATRLNTPNYKIRLWYGGTCIYVASGEALLPLSQLKFPPRYEMTLHMW